MHTCGIGLKITDSGKIKNVNVENFHSRVLIIIAMLSLHLYVSGT